MSFQDAFMSARNAGMSVVNFKIFLLIVERVMFSTHTRTYTHTKERDPIVKFKLSKEDNKIT